MMPATLRLDLDDDGALSLLTLVEDDLGEVLDESSRPLGSIESPATSWRVPSALDAEFDRLAAEWADRVAFGRACRWQAESDYRAGAMT